MEENGNGREERRRNECSEGLSASVEQGYSIAFSQRAKNIENIRRIHPMLDLKTASTIIAMVL